ncbi:MAG TPA: 30S ribosomal protein S13 [Gammaproteobacteria bacterium]|nr:30S ribosomal protein S13 [Gammaproteobacteria bacterium]
MIRVSGVIMPPNKHISIALESIFGIGRTRALQICKAVGCDASVKVSDLKDDVVTMIQKAAAEFEVEGDLRRRVAINIKRLRDIKCYRGLRHRMGLPVHGQRTRTNARTRKGKKKGKGTASGAMGQSSAAKAAE